MCSPPPTHTHIPKSYKKHVKHFTPNQLAKGAFCSWKRIQCNRPPNAVCSIRSVRGRNWLRKGIGTLQMRILSGRLTASEQPPTHTHTYTFPQFGNLCGTNFCTFPKRECTMSGSDSLVFHLHTPDLGLNSYRGCLFFFPPNFRQLLVSLFSLVKPSTKTANTFKGRLSESVSQWISPPPHHHHCRLFTKTGINTLACSCFRETYKV